MLSLKTTNGLFVVLLLSLLSKKMVAQDAQPANGHTRFSIEIDPATYAFKGYDIHLRIQPKNTEHLLLGLGTYAMNFPNVLVNLNEGNRDLGWHVRLNQGYGLFGEYHFTEVNRKWFAGGQAAVQQYQLQKDYFDGDSKHSNLLLMGLGGYTIQPFDFELYFKFWGGLGYTAKIAGETTLGNSDYDVAPLLMFGALHVGYTL